MTLDRRVPSDALVGQVELCHGSEQWPGEVIVTPLNEAGWPEGCAAGRTAEQRAAHRS